MTNRNFTAAITVDKSSQDAFNAVNDVRGWWSQDITGSTEHVGDVFDYRFRDIHRCRIRIEESVPGRRVVWRVLENFFNFTTDKTEWTDTRVVFDISAKGSATEVRMTHVGLVPDYECYDACSNGWTTYVNGSLKSLIETGKGQPNVGDPMNETERALSA